MATKCNVSKASVERLLKNLSRKTGKTLGHLMKVNPRLRRHIKRHVVNELQGGNRDKWTMNQS